MENSWALREGAVARNATKRTANVVVEDFDNIGGTKKLERASAENSIPSFDIECRLPEL
jgi:hypothetical protein